ncbi:COG2827: putative endonuclease containing a URI domain [hydrothermal vent metagenome]|uniref:COG2827: putative endonuclease containing a URI domain n=1 Tax=hydrothermal vent metagenome TaxID=652676 RepID=A0A3B1AEE9_9ZZZZ
MWYVYILQCSDTSLYTGITNDIDSRLHAHNHLTTGAKYTRVRRPVVLVYSESCETRSKAQIRESQIKRLSRLKKLNLIAVNQNT